VKLLVVLNGFVGIETAVLAVAVSMEASIPTAVFQDL